MRNRQQVHPPSIKAKNLEPPEKNESKKPTANKQRQVLPDPAAAIRPMPGPVEAPIESLAKEELSGTGVITPRTLTIGAVSISAK